MKSLTGLHASRSRHVTFSPLMLVMALCLAAAGLTLTVPTRAAQAAIPTMTRAEIIARAETGIGTLYTWGRESWIPNFGSGPGPDCSGYVLKCWEAPRTLLYQEEDGENTSISPRYTSYEFYNCLGPWTALSSRSLLTEGDALATNDGDSGHVVIYAGGDAWNSPIVYEAPGTGRAIRRASRYLSSSYKPLRRNSISDGGIILDNPTAKTVGGGDLAGNWARSTATSGYYGSDYQTCVYATSTAWARWTPRLPSTGSYEVYMRWTSATNRASAVQVNINTANGQFKRYINQQINGGRWVSLGQYGFNAGYSTGSGSITLVATGATGYVVADAVKFVPR